MLKQAYSPIERWVLNKSKAVQVLSSSQIPLLRKYGVKTPVIVIPNGFDLEELENIKLGGQSYKYEKKDGSMKLFYLGRIDAYTKGLDLCIEALSVLDEKLRNKISFVIQGPDWGDKQKLEKLARTRKVHHLIRFSPPNYDQFPIFLIKKHDCLILPSRYDGFGLIVLEAMLARRPIIVSNQVGSVEHVLKAGCGILVDPEPESIALGIQKMYEKKNQWEEMGYKGYTYALEHLAWDKIALKALQDYKKICGI